MTLINLVQQHNKQLTSAMPSDFYHSTQIADRNCRLFNGRRGPAVVENVFAKIDRSLQTSSSFRTSLSKAKPAGGHGHYQATVDEVQRNVATVHYWQGTTNGTSRLIVHR